MEDPWETDVRDFVLEHLASSRSRVLEIGCGAGWLTRAILEGGHDARGIDPGAPEGERFEQVTLEKFTDPKPYDVVVAVLSLHHIGDLPAALEKIRSLLNLGGRILVVEFAWENLDNATLRWGLERLPSDPDREENWLQRRCLEWRERLQQGDDIAAQDHVREWAHREQLHRGKEILGSLREGFHQTFFEWTPYLYPNLGDVTEEEEQAVIDRGEIQPAGFRFVGDLI
ncbi:MAG: class I SAM-dependent methyltransferase [Actinomycetota bacterium]